MNDLILAPKNEIVVYQPNETMRLDVRLENKCLDRCDQLIQSAPTEMSASLNPDGDTIIHSWTSEVVYFLSSILPKGNPVLKNIERVMKSNPPKIKLDEIRGAIMGFKSSLSAGDFDNLFEDSLGFL